MFLALLLLTLCLHAIASPWWLTRAYVVSCGGGGGTTTPRGTLPVTPGAGDGGYGSGSSPGNPPPPLGRPQGPDPLPGRRVSIRPQPMRAPRDEVMALGPPQGREPARAVAGGRTPEWGGGGMARGTATAPLRLPLAPGMTGTVTRDCSPSPPPRRSSVLGATSSVYHLTGEQRGCDARQLEMAAPAPSPGEAPSMGRADNEFHLIREHWGWDVRPLRATAGPCPRRPMPAPKPAGALAPTPRTDPLTPCRLRPELTLVVMAAGSALVGFPSAWARGPDPQCGRRLSIRPQPKRAPRGEVMALGPSRWGGFARAVAGGPTPACGGCGMAWDQAAALLRLSVALGAARGVSGNPPPPPTARTDGGHGLSRQGAPANRGLARMDPTTARSRPSDRCPGLAATCPGPPVACHRPFLPMGRGPRGRARGRGRGCGQAAPPPPPLPLNRRRHHGLALLRWWHAQATLVFPAPHRHRGWASIVCALAPLWGCAPGSCASMTS